MKIVDAAFRYILLRHELYEVRENGGSGTREERRIRSALGRLRRRFDHDGGDQRGLDITRQLDAQVATERAKDRLRRG